MKQIKFSFTDKKMNIILPFEKAEAVMNSPESIVRITDEFGRWTGKTVNKALLMATDEDYEATKQSNKEEVWRENENKTRLSSGETELTEEQAVDRMASIRTEMRSKGFFRGDEGVNQKYGIKRSALNKYFEEHGKEYEISEGQYVIEDLLINND